MDGSSDETSACCPTCGATGILQARNTSRLYPRSPTVAEFLATNIAPPGSYLSEVAQMLEDGKKGLAEANGRAKIQQEELSNLDKYCLRIQQDLDDWKVISHPVRRVPPEVLREIFLACIEEDLGKSLKSDPKLTSVDIRHYMPWVVAQVSSQWRSVALSYPRLWSTISVSFAGRFSFTSKRHHNWEAALGTQIHRSGSHPLAVSIAVTGFTVIPSSGSLIKFLLPTSPRWKELFLTLTLESFCAFVDIEGFLQSLTKLSITRLMSTRDTFPLPASIAPRIRPMFQHCPQLLELCGIPSVLSHFALPEHIDLLVMYRLASTIFQQLVASDSASETFTSLKRVHGLMPYFMLKTALRVSNPISMIRGL